MQRHQDIVLMGDLNGKVGSRRNEGVIGTHGETEINDNGE
jgi:hypothetical protein